jgi:hypothetical protein
MSEVEEPRVIWTAAIKKATFTQKLSQDGTSHTRLQIVCEGDTLPVEGIARLAVLQNETLVLITIEPAQLSFAYAAQKGEPNAEVQDEGARSGGGADQPPPDSAFDIAGL